MNTYTHERKAADQFQFKTILKLNIAVKNSNLLTHTKMGGRPVAVKLGVQIVILTIYFNPFCVEVNGVAEALLSEIIIPLILVNFCYC